MVFLWYMQLQALKVRAWVQYHSCFVYEVIPWGRRDLISSLIFALNTFRELNNQHFNPCSYFCPFIPDQGNCILRLNGKRYNIIESDKPYESAKAWPPIRGQCTVQSQTPVRSNDKKSDAEILLESHDAIVILGYPGSVFQMPSQPWVAVEYSCQC